MFVVKIKSTNPVLHSLSALSKFDHREGAWTKARISYKSPVLRIAMLTACCNVAVFVKIRPLSIYLNFNVTLTYPYVYVFAHFKESTHITEGERVEL